MKSIHFRFDVLDFFVVERSRNIELCDSVSDNFKNRQWLLTVMMLSRIIKNNNHKCLKCNIPTGILTEVNPEKWKIKKQIH